MKKSQLFSILFVVLVFGNAIYEKKARQAEILLEASMAVQVSKD